MKIAITTQGTEATSKIDPRFGRTSYIRVIDTETHEVTLIDNRDTASDGHGAGPKTAQRMLETGAQVLITGNGPGGNAAAVLEKKGIKVLTGAQNLTVEEALNAYHEKSLKT